MNGRAFPSSHPSSILQLGDTSLPEEQPEMTDDEFLQKLHHVLLEVRCSTGQGNSAVRSRQGLGSRSCAQQIHVEEGAMVCPNCSHVYPISNGIPNMVRLRPRDVSVLAYALPHHCMFTAARRTRDWVISMSPRKQNSPKILESGAVASFWLTRRSTYQETRTRERRMGIIKSGGHISITTRSACNTTPPARQHPPRPTTTPCVPSTKKL